MCPLRCRRIAVAALAALGVLLATATCTRGAEWSIDRSARVSAQYSDNFRLSPVRKEGVFGASLSADLRAASRSETSEAAGTAHVEASGYSGDEPEEIGVRLDLSARRTLERTSLGATAGYLRDSTLTSELAETGLVLDRRPRERLSVAPDWRWSITERAAVQAGYQLADVRYPGGGAAGLIDYRTHNGSLTGSYELSELTGVGATLFATRVDSDSPGGNSEVVGVQGELRRRFSETLSGSATAGFFTLSSTVPAVIDGVPGRRRERDTGWLADVSLERRLERTTLRVGGSRELNPSGSGALLRTDRLFAAVSRRLAFDLTATLSGEAVESEAAREGGEQSRARLYRGVASVAWQWSERWSLGASYRHSRQRNAGVRDEAVGNSVSVFAVYTWPRLAAAR